MSINKRNYVKLNVTSDIYAVTDDKEESDKINSSCILYTKKQDKFIRTELRMKELKTITV